MGLFDGIKERYVNHQLWKAVDDIGSRDDIPEFYEAAEEYGVDREGAEAYLWTDFERRLEEGYPSSAHAALVYNLDVEQAVERAYDEVVQQWEQGEDDTAERLVRAFNLDNEEVAERAETDHQPAVIPAERKLVRKYVSSIGDKTAGELPAELKPRFYFVDVDEVNQRIRDRDYQAALDHFGEDGFSWERTEFDSITREDIESRIPGL